MILFGAILVALGVGCLIGIFAGIWIQMENERDRIERGR